MDSCRKVHKHFYTIVLIFANEVTMDISKEFKWRTCIDIETYVHNVDIYLINTTTKDNIQENNLHSHLDNVYIYRYMYILWTTCR